jgi:hypothetical protein
LQNLPFWQAPILLRPLSNASGVIDSASIIDIAPGAYDNDIATTFLFIFAVI